MISWLRFRERALEAGVFLLPLVWWPGLDQPFSTPKLWLLGALAAAAFQTRFDWPWLIWPGAVALSGLFAPFVSLKALLLAVLPVPLAWAAPLLAPSRPVDAHRHDEADVSLVSGWL